jgi:hypothetical protein
MRRWKPVSPVQGHYGKDSRGQGMTTHALQRGDSGHDAPDGKPWASVVCPTFEKARPVITWAWQASKPACYYRHVSHAESPVPTASDLFRRGGHGRSDFRCGVRPSVVANGPSWLLEQLSPLGRAGS